jgi:hypothetical protein
MLYPLAAVVALHTGLITIYFHFRLTALRTGEIFRKWVRQQ